MSHETIYNVIYAQPRGELKRELIACLRMSRATRWPRSKGQDRRGQIAELLSIHMRPPAEQGYGDQLRARVFRTYECGTAPRASP